MLITNYKGISFKSPKEDSTVYIPAEDSHLIAECALFEANEIMKKNKEKEQRFDFNYENSKSIENAFEAFSILELGTGSGFISRVVKKGLVESVKENDYKYEIKSYATDINPDAVNHAISNGVDAYLADIFTPIQNNDYNKENNNNNDKNKNNHDKNKNSFEKILENKFDMILFNPPYLPTKEDEKIPGNLNYAFDGGIDGRKVIVPFLKEVGHHLKENGFFLLLISSMTGLGQVAEEMKKNGFSCTIVAIQKFPFERIIVIKGKKLGNNEDFVIKEELIQNI